MKALGKYGRSLLLGALLVSTNVHAEWPIHRHDPQRTGASSGRSEIDHPTVQWRYYLGGRFGSTIVRDVDRDGRSEVLFVSAGRVVARRADDSTLWQSPLLSFERIVGTADLDRDGTEELVVVAEQGWIAVLRMNNGAILWRTPRNTFGYAVGAVHLADLDRDGSTDVYATDIACGSPNSRGDMAYAFTFRRGFGTGMMASEQTLWQLEQGRNYACGIADTVVDLEGDGRLELVTFSSDTAWVFEGATGRKRPSGNASRMQGYAMGFSLPYGVLTTDVVDVDRDGPQEIVGYTNNSYAPEINSRSVFVMDWNPMRPADARFGVRWRRSVNSVVSDRHVFLANSAVDLNRDGRAEIVTTFVSSGTPTTFIYRGQDGSILSQLPGRTVSGIYQISAQEPPLVALQRNTVLEGYQFSQFTTATTPILQIPDGRSIESATTGRGGTAASEALGVPTADGATRQPLFATANDTVVEMWSVRGGMAARAVSLNLDNRSVLGGLVQQNLERPGPGILLARSDGLLLALDSSLRVLNLGGGVALTGVRSGGFYPGMCGAALSPVTASVAGQSGESVFALDSRAALLHLQASRATPVRPPEVLWSIPRVSIPVLQDIDGDGRREVLVRSATQRGGPVQRIDVYHAVTGQALWGVSPLLRETEQFQGDLVPYALSPGRVALAATVIDGGDGNGRIYGISNRGQLLFATNPVLVAGVAQGPITPIDGNGDGVDELVATMGASLKTYNGSSGALVADGPVMTAGGAHIAVRGQAGPVDLLTVTSRTNPLGLSAQAGSMPGTLSWQMRWHLQPLGLDLECVPAVVRCPDGLRRAGAVLGTPRLLVVDAATGALRLDLVLSGGRAYRREEAPTQTEGSLGDVAATSALMGGRPAFLLGGTEGRLYAVDACAATPTLLWSLPLESSVGAPILSDTDGDGFDEIVVPTADGYLNGIDQERFASPAWVYDTDPSVGITEADVDEVRTIELNTYWAEVPGATSYQWALFDVLGNPVTRNPGNPTDPFITVSATQRRAVVSSGLVRGSRYFFAVRALRGAQASVEALSDGVRILPEAEPIDAGVDASLEDVQEADAEVGVEFVEASVPEASVDGGCDGSLQTCRPELRLGGRAGPFGSCTCSVAVPVQAKVSGRWSLLFLVGFSLWRRANRRRRV